MEYSDATSLDRLANACAGLRARVVYSRLFPDWTPDRTRPQTGRLNKSPHTVHGRLPTSIAEFAAQPYDTPSRVMAWPKPPPFYRDTAPNLVWTDQAFDPTCSRIRTCVETLAVQFARLRW